MTEIKFNRLKLKKLFEKTKIAQQKAQDEKHIFQEYLEKCFGTNDCGGDVDYREYPINYTFEEFLDGENITKEDFL